MENGTEAPQKKGLGTLAWIGIGCGVLVVVIVVALAVGGLFLAKKAKDVVEDLDFEGNPGLAAARMVVRLSPELEEVGVDEEDGTITIRNTKTGEQVTVDFEEVKDGRIRWSTGEGEVTIDASGDEEGTVVSVTDDKGKTVKLTAGAEASGELPDWLPLYPGTEPQGRHAMTGDEGIRGAFQLETDDPVSEVVEFYRSSLSEEGLSVNTNVFSGDAGEQGGLVTGSNDAEGRSVTVMVGTEDGRRTISVTYSEER
jgi:hypothetical protein